MRSLFNRFHVFLLIALGIMFCTSHVSHAQFLEDEEDDENKVHWELHESAAGSFATKFPQKYKYKIFPFQIDDYRIAFTAEILSTLDGEENTNEKSIMIKSMHTLGEELSYTQVVKTLERVAKKYEASARLLKGRVITNEDIKHKGFLGKKIYIAYEEKGEKYGLRLQVYMTNYALVEQVIVGPATTMYSYRSDDFFKSIKLFDGIIEQENPIGVGWIAHESRNKLFTVMLPPKNSDYTPNPPTRKVSPKKEVFQFEIHDPVLAQKMLYTITAYKFDNPLTRTKAKDFLISQHVAKFVENANTDNLKTQDTITGEINNIKTKVVIAPLKSMPYVRVISFDVEYNEDTMLVKEMWSSPSHANVGIDRTFFKLTSFHPEKYSPAKPERKSPPASKKKGEEEETKD